MHTRFLHPVISIVLISSSLGNTQLEACSPVNKIDLCGHETFIGSPHDYSILSRLAEFGPGLRKDELPTIHGDVGYEPWGFFSPFEIPEAAVCLEAALLYTPNWPGHEGEKYWHIGYADQFGYLPRRIQQDQKSCSLNDFYQKYKSMGHDRAEVALMCAGLLFFDPGMTSCLQENRKPLRALVRKLPGNHSPGYETYRVGLLRMLFASTLWDPAYNEASSWLYKNLYPVMDRTPDTVGEAWSAIIISVHLYKTGDKTGLFNYIATHKGGCYISAPLYFRLGLNGDEYARAKKITSDAYVLQIFSPEFQSQFTPSGTHKWFFDPLKPKYCIAK